MNYRVFIIEDDFRVAEINKAFIQQIDGFTVCGIAHSGKDAIDFLRNAEPKPDIIVLDVYIPDVEKLELLWDIRKKYQMIDIIMVTAANEVETIEEALHGGIFDYLIKPIDFERLQRTLTRYLEKKAFFQTKHTVSQEEMDKLQGLHFHPGEKRAEEKQFLPKGIDRLTLNKVLAILEKIGNQGVSAVEISKEVGISRSTARRYLEYLVEIQQVHAELKYGDVGRPERRYFYSVLPSS